MVSTIIFIAGSVCTRVRIPKWPFSFPDSSCRWAAQRFFFTAEAQVVITSDVETMRCNGIPVLSRDGNKNRHVVISLDVCVLGPGRLHKAVRGYTAEQ